MGRAAQGPVVTTALAAPQAAHTADLVPVAVGALPASVVGGAAGKLTVRVVNAGTAAFSGPVELRLLVSSDATADGGDSPLVDRTVKLSLKPGKSKSIKFKFVYPSGLPSAAYTVLAQLDPGAVAQELPKTDNVAAAGQVTIAPPFTDLAASFPTPLAAGYKAGKKSTVAVKLTNLGNVLATGMTTITLSSSADAVSDAGDTTVGTLRAKVKLKPGASKTYKVKLALPAGFTAGSTQLFASLASTGLTDSNAQNDTVLAAQPFVVT